MAKRAKGKDKFTVYLPRATRLLTEDRRNPDDAHRAQNST